MGTVTIEEHWSDLDIQESFITVYEYTYCDKCGSFDIEIKLKIPVYVSNILVIIMGLAWIGFFIILYITQMSCLPSIITVCVGIVAFCLLGMSSYQQCRKCGNRKISSRNILDYPINDKSIIDVPQKEFSHRIIRRKIKRL